MLSIAERVRRARTKAGLSQRGLSLKAGLSPAAVSSIERRAGGGISAETAAALAKVLGMSVDTLLTGTIRAA
tara:strand:- start:227 stop:442 length:216 start_codon:yes stop_codon:yes gene_type:complete